MSLPARRPARDWQPAAAGFIALTVLAAAVDSRTAVIDRSAAGPSSSDREVAPLTTPELVREMMTHD